MPLPRRRKVVPLRPFRDLERVFGPSSVGIVDLASERQRREVHRNLAEQIVAVALKELVLLYVHDDVEIAGRTAALHRIRLRPAAAGAGPPRFPPES